jgi:hypothetical protein
MCWYECCLFILSSSSSFSSLLLRDVLPSSRSLSLLFLFWPIDVTSCCISFIFVFLAYCIFNGFP